MSARATKAPGGRAPRGRGLRERPRMRAGGRGGEPPARRRRANRGWRHGHPPGSLRSSARGTRVVHIDDRRTLVEVDKRLAHLDPFFGAYRVVAIDRSAILRYVEARQAAKASNGTVNREVSLLGTMLRDAMQSNKLLRLPDLRKLRLKEAEPRSGFFEEEQLQRVRKHLPDDLQTAVTVAYTYGWRMQSEVLSLECRHLDLTAGTLSLDPA